MSERNGESRQISEGPETQATSSPAHPRIDQGAPQTGTDARRPSPRHRRPVMTGRRIALCACGGVLSAHLLDAREAPNGKPHGRRKTRRTQPPSDPARE